VNKKGEEPIKADLDRINAISNKEQLMRTVGYLHDQGARVLFGFSSQPDLHNATMYIAGLSQGGLSLPDRDYYLKTDPKSVERRQKFVEYAAELFKLLGDSPEKAKANAASLLELETALATASMDRTARRDPKNLDHRTTLVAF